jgi:hypothetical protein
VMKNTLKILLTLLYQNVDVRNVSQEQNNQI